jgi:hypothetical protein
MTKPLAKLLAASLLCLGGLALAQFNGGDNAPFGPGTGFGPQGGGFGGGGGGGGRRFGGGGGAPGMRRTPDGLLESWPEHPSDLSDRHGVGEWPMDPHFKNDTFTFCRIHYHSFRYADSWLTDFPDSDLNFSFRLQQLTSLKVNPNPVRIELTDDKLFDYPFIYMLEVATLEFRDDEITALRKYLLNGGFLMVDDFWGEAAWNHFHDQMKRVFPDREPVDLDLSHPIFHCVFDLKEKPQVPGIEFAVRHKEDGVAWEQPDAKGAHYRAYYDDHGRIMALVCQNTDLGDGWEREGDDVWYFHEYSEKRGYPMGVNIVFYAMTH